VAPPGGSLVVIGNFDGVHLGHRAVLEASSREADARGLATVALTFEPHPSAVLGRGAEPVLTTLERKIELLGRVCPGLTVVVEAFTQDLASLSPAAFAETGHGRAGDLATLEGLGQGLGFEARAQPLHGDARGPYSSSRIREALAAGDLVTAEALLGRPHSLSGTVVRGAGRGRTIGVPTANLDGVAEALPPYGVYACVVDRLDSAGPSALAKAVINVGERPTVGAGFSVEAHLFDFEGDLYGERLRLHLCTRLREERRFAGLDELRAQIARDMNDAKDALATRTPTAKSWY